MHETSRLAYIAKVSEWQRPHTCMTIHTSNHTQLPRTHPRVNGMFDVDCSNIGVRCPPKLSSIPSPPQTKVVTSAKPKGQDSKIHVSQSHKVDTTEKIRLCDTPSLPCNPRRNQLEFNPTQTGVRASAAPPPYRVNILLQRETLASMYVASMFIGFAALGIVGGASSQQHVFLSFSLFYGVFIPVVILHGTSVISVIHRVWAAIPMLMYLIYAPVSVSLSIIHKSHIFLSISLVMVGFCFVIAGVGGWIRIVSAVVLALFTSLCFGGVLHNPDRGDVVALVVVPIIQIIYVCLAGVVSVIMIPVSVVEKSTNQTGYQDRLVQIL